MRYVKLQKQLQANYDGMLAAARMHEDVELIMRHDMKGPLAGVIGMVQALVESPAMNQNQLKQLRVIEETALLVMNMINLSSELFKIETGRFQLDAQPVLIGDILGRIVEMARTTFTEKHITIALEIPQGEDCPQALGDAMFCYSLFQNLLRNACEAAPEKSRITVVLIDENPLQIVMTNKGVVPMQIRANFFEKYITQGKQGGTGLGTYSAKLLAEAQHGKISLEVSDVDNQTTIKVLLPRA
jgi:signal transduction histidine kinase